MYCFFSFQTLHPGDESLPIPYAVDLSCEVVVDYNVSVLRVHRVKVAFDKENRPAVSV